MRVKAAEGPLPAVVRSRQLLVFEPLLYLAVGQIYQFPQVRAVPASTVISWTGSRARRKASFASEVTRLLHISRYLNIANVI